MIENFAREHPWLRVDPTVELTDLICISVEAARPHFEKHQIKGEVTSGKRDALNQVKEIIRQAHEHGIADLFPEFVQGIKEGWAPEVLVDAPVEIQTKYKLTKVYWWQRTLSRELAIGVIINPAIKCHILDKYVRKSTGEDMDGKFMEASDHEHGTCWDLGARQQLDEKKVVAEECQADPACRISYIRVELVNGCIHFGCA
jgi:hypothetical protein